LGERLAGSQKVRGSSPLSSTENTGEIRHSPPWPRMGKSFGARPVLGFSPAAGIEGGIARCE
jgi:hypothetical protein